MITERRARHTLWLLSFTRWFPVGLVIGLTILLELQRGMSLGQIGVIASVQGFVVLGLELPTGGLADAIGRRPVLLIAGVVGLGSWVLFVNAHSLGAFMAAAGLQGVYRALDSGPLEAWYVDAAQADVEYPGESGTGAPAGDHERTRVEHALSVSNTVLGVAIAAGALLSGGLIAWRPFSTASPLLLPFWVAIGFALLHLAGNALLVRELPRREAGVSRSALIISSVREAPRVVRDGLGTLRGNRVLRCLVLVEVFWSVAMIGFETLNPVRLAELVGGEDRAGAILGPVSSASWGLFAVGALVAGLLSRRIGVTWTALAARVLNGLFVIMMGLAQGPVGLISAYLITYTLHGSAGPMHATLLHRQAERGNRATVLSMNSMISGGMFSLGVLALGPLAEHTSTATAIIVAGAFSMFGALLYLPALREERSQRRSMKGRPRTDPVVAEPERNSC